jgi:hypothetical protein
MFIEKRRKVAKGGGREGGEEEKEGRKVAKGKRSEGREGSEGKRREGRKKGRRRTRGKRRREGRRRRRRRVEGRAEGRKVAKGRRRQQGSPEEKRPEEFQPTSALIGQVSPFDSANRPHLTRPPAFIGRVTWCAWAGWVATPSPCVHWAGFSFVGRASWRARVSDCLCKWGCF